ncbi:endonuclease/exonuclease/phosphatase family protein [Sediminicoccus sp. KRV36]|uniref:endonuclease/exonuclease/phosphatase family protein n=1 Tax=Sediminicoccus sp. KRV36 TaxID=3133721 RepID=UPI00200D0BA4|nr:endonuclease/exonuclease/phosphatase family protein [Sediminicoccus rosea]UPY38046.1 endonuclease/exonuclease/phosphatase family protein [Sediminicoccus rosea]
MRLVLLFAALLLALPTQAAELKIASWNIAWLTLRPAHDPDLPRNLTPRQPGDFTLLADYARRLDADVVALQEVDGPEAAARIFNPRDYAFFFPDERDIQRTGFAVKRSLRAIRNADLAELDLAPNARFSLRRGTDITVESEGRMLRLLSVHLNAGCREGPMEAGRGRECENLGRQSEILAGWIAARRAENAAFAILGDFNRRIGDARDDMLAQLTRAAPLTRVNEGVSNPCWADARGGRPFISHIFLGGAAQRWAVPNSLRVMVYAEREPAMRDRLSDHCPVSFRIRMN